MQLDLGLLSEACVSGVLRVSIDLHVIKISNKITNVVSSKS